MKYLFINYLKNFYSIILLLVAIGCFNSDNNIKVDENKFENLSNIHGIGVVEGVTGKINLSPQKFGFIKKINVVEGQFVEEGCVLLELESENQSKKIKICKLQIKKNKYALKKAELYLNKLKNLTFKDSVSDVTFDNAKFNVAILKSEIKILEENLCILYDDLDKFKLKSPTKGIILSILCEKGEPAGINYHPVIVMSDITKFRVKGFVDAFHVFDVKLNQSAEISFDNRSYPTLKGKIIFISPKMSKKKLFDDAPDEYLDTEVMEILIDLNKSDFKLIFGLKVNIIIFTSPKK